jgi:nicotinamidase-related amidase
VPLLSAAQSQLIVIDVQERFYGPDAAIDRGRLADATARAGWLVGVAAALGIPVTITEEDPDRNGPTVRSIRDRLPRGAKTHVKPVFGLADVPEVLSSVAAVGRETAVLVGLETDVCVAHSAIGLLDRGYRVAVVTDATFAPGEMHEHGLARMTAAGVLAVHAKGVYYEWVRTLEAARRLEAEHPDLAEPPGFSL